MSDITFTLSLSFTDGGQKGSVTPVSTIQEDFSASPTHEDSAAAAATTYAALSFPSVGWTNITFAGFINHSEDTLGVENIILGRHSQFTAGGTDDGSFDGGALGNTLTAAGYYKECTVAGTSQGKTWQIGDIAVYLGSSGTYLQLRPAPIFKLRPGDVAGGPICGDGKAWKYKSESGTPRLGWAVTGALA